MRHWIIGNGSSLNHTPLELLQSEVSWGMNRIHLHYRSTSWRPTFFFMCDWNQQNEHNYWRECIEAHRDIPKWLWEGFRNGSRKFPELEPMGEVPNTTWIQRCEKHHYYAGDNYMKRAEHWHLPDLCTAFSGLGAVMQLAFLNGATEIYLLGCDLYQGGDYSKNFFVPEYANDRRDRSETDNTNMTQVHRVAARSCPIPIYNCTIGGALEVHERKNMLDVLNG